MTRGFQIWPQSLNRTTFDPFWLETAENWQNQIKSTTESMLSGNGPGAGEGADRPLAGVCLRFSYGETETPGRMISRLVSRV